MIVGNVPEKQADGYAVLTQIIHKTQRWNPTELTLKLTARDVPSPYFAQCTRRLSDKIYGENMTEKGTKCDCGGENLHIPKKSSYFAADLAFPNAEFTSKK